MTAASTPRADEVADSLQALFAGEIRSLMARRRISQVAMSRLMGRPQSYVSRIYRGEGSITLHDVEAFAAALGVAPLALLAAPSGAENAATSSRTSSRG